MWVVALSLLCGSRRIHEVITAVGDTAWEMNTSPLPHARPNYEMLLKPSVQDQQIDDTTGVVDYNCARIKRLL